MSGRKNNLLWWQRGIIYQVYPRSFKDSNADGIGDLNGIITRLDYLAWLGIDAIWISPVNSSPMIDFGYDISDYQNIDPLFGTLQDFDTLIREAHARGMKIIVDFVPNHTSDQHPWFRESRSSINNTKRSWYLWQSPRSDGGPPNNWLSEFGGSAWEWDEKTQQYYYHAFDKSQPDLNWRNPEVQQAMMGVIRFWLDLGVDGFRVDVMWHLIKDQQLRDNPVNPDYQPHMAPYHQLLALYSTDQPEVHDIVRMMRAVLDSYDERMMIGEVYLPVKKLVAYYGQNLNGAHLPFNFQLISLPWNSLQLYSAITEYESMLPLQGWPNWVLSNHDKPRIASRVGIQQAYIAAMLLLTLRGTPTIYYGDEIGMQDVAIPPEEIQDPRSLNTANPALTRDPARTPMQWDRSINAGFTEGKPWLRIGRQYATANVQAQKEDSNSMLLFYKRLIQLRNAEPAFTAGDFVPVYADHQIISYKREMKGQQGFLVLLNLSHRTCYFNSENENLKGTIELATSHELEGKIMEGTISLSGDEGIIVRLQEI